MLRNYQRVCSCANSFQVVGQAEAMELTQAVFDLRSRQHSRLLSKAIQEAANTTQIVGSSLKRSLSQDTPMDAAPAQKFKKTDSAKQPIQARLGPASVKDRLGPKADASNDVSFTTAASTIGPQEAREKCAYWPNCTRGSDCRYIHPTKMCFQGAECKRGKACTYIHPSDLVQKVVTGSSTARIPCKFAQACTKPDCAFSHPPGHPLSINTLASSAPPKTLCKFDPQCLNPACPFYHPSRTLGSPTTALPKEVMATIQCKFDPFCTRAGCLYRHGPKEEMSPSEKFVQLAPMGSKNKTLGHISARSFAVPDEETEKVGMEVDAV